MAEIINLNRFRKAVQKARAGEQAAQNRVQFGRSKEERESDAARRLKEEKDLDGKKKE